MRLRALSVSTCLIILVAPLAYGQTRCADEIYSILRTPIRSKADVDQYVQRMRKFTASWEHAFALREYFQVGENNRERAASFEQTIDSLELLEPVLATTDRAKKALSDFRQRLQREADSAKRRAADDSRIVDERIGSLCGVESAPPLTRTQPPSPPPEPTPRPRPHPRGTFTRDDSLTVVTNTHQRELTIDPAGQSAHFDNRGMGGASWQTNYKWTVPETLVAGEETSVIIGAEILGVQPRQSISDGINVLAPDFAKQVIARYPDNPSVSEKYPLTISAGYRDANELKITVGFVSSSVVYTYRRN